MVVYQGSANLWWLGLCCSVIVEGALGGVTPSPAQALDTPASSHSALPSPWDDTVLQAAWLTDDPRAGLAFVHLWQQHGRVFPDALLKRIVEAAVRPEAAYSGRRLPLIPVETCHRFRSKVATDSD
ncbi:MAG: hypothetical protein FJZ47_07795 [Candidatus Tectomicrobia bacterium]|uniref:Uncharacterized protein n=1 Tax=Tectimicrobiota bacterium TaxID=2528274 RepID=A0A937W0V5_UNCTE|nr:hypothetical protein [Candidatus Tectomicrobia bacterium]